MPLLKTVTLQHTPSSHSVHIGLFSNVKNPPFLLEQLHSGNSDYEYALIDARVIISEIHIYAACFQAISNQIMNKLKTRNVHSEVVYCLSPKNNIATSFANFGITSKTSNLIAIRIGPKILQSIIHTHLKQAIEGEDVQFSDVSLSSMTDWVAVDKLYNLNGLGVRMGAKMPDEMDDASAREIEALVLSGMAVKGATN